MEDRLVVWIRSRKVREQKVSLSLRHGTTGNKASPVQTWSEKEVEELDAEELCNKVWSAAQDDADGLEGRQKYLLVAVEGDTPRGRFVFVLHGTENIEDDGDSIVSEQATPAGFAAQALRHVEAMMRLTSGAQEVNNRSMQNTLRALQARNELLEEKHTSVLTTLEALMDARAERDMVQMREVNKERRLDQTFDKFALLLPTVANKLLGKKLLPEKVSSGEESFYSVMESLSTDQFQKIMTSLDPSQQIAVIEMYNKVKAVREAAQKEKDQATKRITDGLKDSKTGSQEPPKKEN